MDIENCNFYFSPQDTFSIQIETSNLRFNCVTLDDNPFLVSKTVPIIKSHFTPIHKCITISGSVMDFSTKTWTVSGDNAVQVISSQLTCNQQW